MICPCCGKPVKRTHFACQMASKGGSVKSEAKTAANRKNIKARWDKVKAKKKKPIGKVLDAQFAKPKRKKP